MDTYWKIIAAVLISVILGLAIGRNEKDLSLLLTMAVCAMATIAVVSFFEPILDFLWEVSEISNIEDGMLGILLKIVSICLVTEVAGMICTDSGNNSLGKMLQILGSAVIMYLSLPLFQALLTLIREILGEL